MDVVYFDQCLGGTHSKCYKFAPKVVKGYKQLQFLLMGTHGNLSNPSECASYRL